MRRTLFLATALCCASCDPYWGVYREATIRSSIPSDQCVVRALQTVPGITNVTGNRPATAG